MSLDLSEEQSQLLKELKVLDPDPAYKGFSELPTASSRPAEEEQKPDVELLFEVDYDSEHAKIRDKLMSYRKKSEQIYRVGELIKEYDSKFGSLMEEKRELVELIEKMKGSTSELVEKQKRMIDLSMKMKQSLDYYSYHDKFVFDYPCEIACREMFENSLQPTLSELTDGIQYFQENSTYSQSKKYLAMFQASRSKILSFVKSFFIKLFNREQSFTAKNCKTPLTGLIDSLYPKSKIKFISAFLLHFPQFQQHLEDIIKSIKESSSEDETKFLQLKEMEIYEFELNKPNISLIGYLQRNMPDIYDEAILTYFTFYRLSFHQNLLKIPYKKEGKFPELFGERVIHMIYLVSCEYAYQAYCCRANQAESAEVVKNNITAITKLYSEELMRFLKDARNKLPFQLCEAVSKIKEEIPSFLERHMQEQYQSYAFGAVSQFINNLESIEFLKSLFGSFTRRILSEMETMCFNCLPKVGEARSKGEVEEQVKEFLLSIPKLKFCESQAERYLIGSLDAIDKSIKEASSRMQSRFECYIWNIELFSNIKGALRSVKGNLVRKELKLDVNNSTNIIERFRGIERNDSLLKYAQDIFNVIKTGMPVINELTFDFNEFITKHCRVLETQFVKDILFIYAKNMIEFLHNLEEALKEGEAKGKAVCSVQVVENLYSTYVLSIEKYVKEANRLLAEWKSYKIGVEAVELIPGLLDQVYEHLFDYLDFFYVNTSKLVSTESFKEIEALKQAFKKGW